MEAMLFRFMKFRRIAVVCLIATAVTAVAASSSCSAQASAAGASSISTTVPSVDQIVEQMRLHNQARKEELRSYQSVRHYEVEYKGYAHLDAKLVVEASYDSASGKSFRIVSQSGSGLLVDKVLKRLVQSEMEAGQDHHATDLSPANYKFRLLGTETLGDRPTFVLAVEPITSNKFLYRGKVWVDAEEFALTRVEAEPAKNPSFWISSTAINHEYSRTDGFWLPAQNRSKTRVRVGGTAVLTIDYGTYEVVPAKAAAARLSGR